MSARAIAISQQFNAPDKRVVLLQLFKMFGTVDRGLATAYGIPTRLAVYVARLRKQGHIIETVNPYQPGSYYIYIKKPRIN